MVKAPDPAFGFTVSGCGQIFEFVYCDYGYGGVENSFYQTGVNLLDKSLALDHLDNEQKPKHLQDCAWAHYNLENNQQALDDQQAAFALKSPAQKFEYINHAAYLKKKIIDLPSEYFEIKTL